MELKNTPQAGWIRCPAILKDASSLRVLNDIDGLQKHRIRREFDD
jgi:hypothetical protein